VDRDPFYEDIVTGLKGTLNPDMFEHCAGDILRDAFPGLVPIRGGADAGMDGAVADGTGLAFPLVCTTAKDVIGNLTKNIKSYVEKGGERRSAVLATSRFLTPKKRQNLVGRAKELGFQLVQVFDGTAIADRLYQSPEWTRALLGLTGQPSALSAMPCTRRPLLNVAPIGREKDADWLRGSVGDRLVVGQPGCGKTFLLHSLVREGWGLFLVDGHRDALAVAIRKQRPHTVVVDDAHVDPQFLTELRHLRTELHASFDIVATGWSGTEDTVREHLGIPSDSVRKLGLLSRNEIVEVIRTAGLHARNDIMRELVNQSEGLPGLAVTLATEVLRGDLVDVVGGDVLIRHVARLLSREETETALCAMAALSLGGERGMAPPSVAGGLELPLVNLRGILANLASGGVVRVVEDNRLSVRPPALRHALVKRAFFDDIAPLALERFTAATNTSELARVLVGARARGANVPDSTLLPLLEQARDDRLWDQYAWLGRTETEWVLDNHAEALIAVANTALKNAPRRTVMLLLSQAVGDDRETHSHVSHPLRLVEDWLSDFHSPGSDLLAARREALAATVDWASQGGDAAIVSRAIALLFSSGIRCTTNDPGAGHTITFHTGVLPAGVIRELRELWPTAARVLQERGVAAWESVFSALHSLCHPHIPNQEVGEDIICECRELASVMLGDLAGVADGRPGVLSRLREFAETLPSPPDLAVEDAYTVLFPRERFPDDHDAWFAGLVATAEAEASEWMRLGAEGFARHICRLEQEARLSGMSWPRLTPTVCGKVASECEDPVEWAQALMTCDASSDLVACFLREATERGTNGYQDLTAQCFNRARYRHGAMGSVLRMTEPPGNLLRPALDAASDDAQFVEHLCMRAEVPEPTLRALLVHDDAAVAEAAAVGEWCCRKHEGVRESVWKDWRSAILRSSKEEHWLQRILGQDPELALEWLKRHVGTAEVNHFVDKSIHEALTEELDTQSRLELLESLDAESLWEHAFVGMIVGDDMDAFDALLADASLSEYHLEPLGRKLDDVWRDMVLRALDAGHAPEEIAGASLGSHWHWCGNESDMWAGWAEDFSRWLDDENSEVREVAQHGRRYAEANRQRALSREEQREVYGD